MTTTDILDDIELTLAAAHPQLVVPDRRVMLKWMSNDLGDLTLKLDGADFLYVHLDPALSLSSGVRVYALPTNFPQNFAPHAGERFTRNSDYMTRHCCKLDDGTNEQLIDYESPPIFYSRNLRAESNGIPSVYTVVSTPAGGRQIILSPPPDANATYTIDGLYSPTDWRLDDPGDLPPIPGNCLILKWAILMRIVPDYAMYYDRTLAELMTAIARTRTAQMLPNTWRM